MKLIPNKSIIFFLIMAVIIIVLWLMGESASNMLTYHRSAIADGQIWRLFTGHLIHSNLWHLLLNLASLIMIGWLFSQHLSYKIWMILFTLSALMISFAYYFTAPQFEYYVGLSAILYAVIIIGALQDIKHQPTIAGLILLVVTGRVIWQQLYGTADELEQLIDQRVAIESHLFGIITGYVLGMIVILRKQILLSKTKD
ncbi:MAG: rhombosortase [Gammaproteobacteria bacterium]|nr:rhombosortase [Gammaproteobacteria bacterium]